MSKPIKYAGDVVALTLIDAETLVKETIVANTKVLIGARRPETNKTHQFIVSVPTQRIPSNLANNFLQKNRDLAKSRNFAETPPIWVDNQNKNGHDPIIYTVENLLSRKLGVSVPLEQGKIHYRASLAVKLLGWANYKKPIDGSDYPYGEKEYLRMFNIVVQVLEGVEIFPNKTQSYEPLKWATAADYNNMMDGKDVSLVGFDGFKFCVDGLCIDSTHAIIKAELTPLQL